MTAKWHEYSCVWLCLRGSEPPHSIHVALLDLFGFKVLCGFAGPHINWTTPPERMALLPRQPASGVDGGEGNAVHWRVLSPESSRGEWGPVLGTFDNGNLQRLGADKEVVFITTNRGMSVRLFGNEVHGPKLRSMGLTPETAFGCAVNFLFEPVAEVMDAIKAEAMLLRRPGVFSIGMHARIGDQVMLGGDGVPSSKIEDFTLQTLPVSDWFKCAEQVEQQFFEGHDVLWLFVSDSAKLRELVKERYGTKVIVPNASKIEHTFTAQTSVDGFRSAVAEHWLFGMTTAHVITYISGYGRTAAYRGMRDGRIFTIGTSTPNCSVGAWEHTKVIEAAWHNQGLKLY